MKIQLSRFVALLVLAAMGFTSCSASYRENRRHRHDDHDHGHEHNSYRN